VAVACAHPQISEMWVECVEFASRLLHLAAHEIGRGGCRVQVRLREHDAQRSAAEYLSETIGLDLAAAVGAMVAIGYPGAFSSTNLVPPAGIEPATPGSGSTVLPGAALIAACTIPSATCQSGLE
jgi:hypothetical protein